MAIGYFQEIKRPGRGVDHPPTSNVEVKERVELYFYSTFGPFVACSRVNFTFTFIFMCLIGLLIHEVCCIYCNV